MQTKEKDLKPLLIRYYLLQSIYISHGHQKIEVRFYCIKPLSWKKYYHEDEWINTNLLTNWKRIRIYFTSMEYFYWREKTPNEPKFIICVWNELWSKKWSILCYNLYKWKIENTFQVLNTFISQWYYFCFSYFHFDMKISFSSLPHPFIYG